MAGGTQAAAAAGGAAGRREGSWQRRRRAASGKRRGGWRLEGGGWEQGERPSASCVPGAAARAIHRPSSARGSQRWASGMTARLESDLSLRGGRGETTNKTARRRLAGPWSGSSLLPVHSRQRAAFQGRRRPPRPLQQPWTGGSRAQPPTRPNRASWPAAALKRAWCSTRRVAGPRPATNRRPPAASRRPFVSIPTHPAPPPLRLPPDSPSSAGPPARAMTRRRSARPGAARPPPPRTPSGVRPAAAHISPASTPGAWPSSPSCCWAPR